MLAIIHCTLTFPDHYLPDAYLLAENGRISDFGSMRKFAPPQCARTIDAGGAFVGPGLIDIHTHAADGAYITDAPEATCAHLLKHGVTGVLPALYFNMDAGGYLRALDTLDAAMRRGACPNMLGCYMEGPYLNPKFGCDRENNPWKGDIRREDYAEVLDRAKDMARVWALAPERAGIEAFVKDVKRACPRAVFSVAHSEAAPEAIEALMPYGLRLATHHTNATGDLVKYPECRGVCVDETVNYNDDIYAELIVDEHGIHVAPYMLRLVAKLKGKRKIILVSDACVFDGPIPPGYEGVTDINFDDAGEIAGSKLTLDRACGNMIKHTGCSIADAFTYASLNPAKLLGLNDRGEIRVGARADMVIADGWMHIAHTILEGELIQ